VARSLNVVTSHTTVGLLFKDRARGASPVQDHGPADDHHQCSLAPARLFGRRFRQLGHGDQSIRRSGVHGGIVRAEVRDGSETVANQHRLELASRPTPHDEPIVGRLFAGVVDQRMRFGQKKLVAIRIEFRGARECERASIRLDSLSKDGLALLPVPRGLPLANVENQDAFRSKRAREGGEHRSACVFIYDVVENTAAENAVVARRRESEQISDAKRHGIAVTADGLPGSLDQLGRLVYAFHGITSAREFAGVSARPTAGIEKRCAGKDAPLDEPGRDRCALLTDGTIDQQIEGPRVLTVKRTGGLRCHGTWQRLYISETGLPLAAKVSEMAIKRLDNIGIVVEDLAAAIDFFRELGLELEGRATIEGEWAGRVTGLGDQRVEIAMMRTPDGHGRLELSRFLAPAVVADHRNAPVNALGYLRVMFAVDDIDETLERLRNRGAQLVGEVVRYKDAYRLCYIRGPEALLIGLAQELS
jgi:catechol 2,3-dioxygenase-like lactoylglutathione lyase family enzyme